MAEKIAASLDDMPDQADLSSRSGLEFMQDLVAGKLAGPTIGATLGFRPVLVEDGKVTIEGAPEFNAINPMRGVHGGWYGAVLDSCMGCAVMTKLPKGSVYTTLEYRVNIIRAIPIGMAVRAIGTTDHVGRSTGVAHGEIRGIDDGRLYATGSTTCLVMKAPATG